MIGERTVIDHGGVVRKLLFHLQKTLLKVGNSGFVQTVRLQAMGNLSKSQGAGIQAGFYIG